MKFLQVGCAVALLSASPVAATADDQARERTAEKPNIERQDREQNQQELTSFYAGSLTLMNNSTIRMSELAQRKTSTPEVREFAQKLTQAHTQLNQQLQRFAPGEDLTSLGENRFSATERESDENLARTNDNQSEDLALNSEGADEAVEIEVEAARPDRTARKGDLSEWSPLHRVLTVSRNATRNYIDGSTRQMQKYQGREFDMAYLGYQIGAHTWAVSELEAIQKANVGSPEFQKLVKDATQAYQSHLKQATQLSQTFEGEAGSRATRREGVRRDAVRERGEATEIRVRERSEAPRRSSRRVDSNADSAADTNRDRTGIEGRAAKQNAQRLED